MNKELIYNQLKEVLTERYMVAKFIPSADLLVKLEMTKRRFNSIYNKKSDPNFHELLLIQEVLNVTPKQLHKSYSKKKRATSKPSASKLIHLKSEIFHKYNKTIHGKH
jgi:hypothetical protein